jgi:PTH1 family peptidyl-tRNA hydrolase
MNSSGQAIGPLMNKRGIGLADVTVVVDDVDLDLGRLRIRGQGSPGGHNGLKSVQAALGSDEYVRVRVGVGRPKGDGEMIGHVLSRFAPDEKDAAAKVIERAADAVEMLVGDGLVKAMNSFNG